jgi:hypothetical protein
MVDHTAQFTAKATMDAATLREFERGVPTSVCRDIAKDHLGRPTALPTIPSVTPGKPGSNWKETPITPPPGIAILDEMLAQEDRLWRRRRELAAKLGAEAPNDEPPSAV